MSKKKSREKQSRKAGGKKTAGQASGGPLFNDIPDLIKARGLWNQAQFDRALKLFKQVVKANPNNVIALVDAARAYGSRFELNKAERYLDQAILLAPDRAEVLHLAGQSYRMIHRPGKAMDCLRQIVKQDANLPDAYLELGLLCERRHEHDEATTVIDDLLRRQPRFAEAKVVKAVLLCRTGQYSDAETLLRDIARSDKPHWHTRARAWGELANLLDKQSQYDEAFEAAGRAKAILRPKYVSVLKDAQRQATRLYRLNESMNAEIVKKWRQDGAGYPKQSMALLTGPARSGTTLLEKVLDAHEGIISSDEREAFPRFIFQSLVMDSDCTEDLVASRLDDVPRERLLANRHKYMTYMSESLGERIGDRLHLDKNPSITPVMPGVLRLFPESKIIFALRDPRDVVLSTYMQFFAINNVSISYLTIDGGAQRYAYEVDIWLKLRDMMPDRWVQAKYEDTVKDLPGQAKRVVEFLGLDWDGRILNYREHLKTRQTDSPTYADVVKPVYSSSVGRWKHYEKHLEPVLDRLEPFLEAFNYTS